jgi:hypothetical protein
LIYEIERPTVGSLLEVRSMLQLSVPERVRAHLRSDSLNAFVLHQSRTEPGVYYCYVHFDDMLSFVEWSAYKRRRHALRRRTLARVLRGRGVPSELIREVLGTYLAS